MKKNVAASVSARLMNKARASGRPFAELLQYYGLERFLFRLSRLPSSDQFVLKGALMLQVWGAPQSRPTRDIDVIAYADNEISTIEQIIREACELRVEDDGVRFDAESVTGERAWNRTCCGARRADSRIHGGRAVTDHVAGFHQSISIERRSSGTRWNPR